MKPTQMGLHIQYSMWTAYLHGCGWVNAKVVGECSSFNCPGFDPSILRHSGTLWAAGEAVLNFVHKKKKIRKIFPFEINIFHGKQMGGGGIRVERKRFLPLFSLPQGVTKRCRLFWLTNSAGVYEPKCGGKGGRCGVSANEYSSANGAQINFGDLTQYLT